MKERIGQASQDHNSVEEMWSALDMERIGQASQDHNSVGEMWLPSIGSFGGG